jgi:hypothetical protein
MGLFTHETASFLTADEQEASSASGYRMELS